MALNTLERDDLLRQIAWLKARTDKIERMLKGEQVGTARIADAAITNAKIKDLTWDKAVGGTLHLGGIDNVDGEMSIKDGSGVEKITLDKDGMVINDGKITIKDSTDTTVLDINGLTTSNFIYDLIEQTTEQSTTSDTFEDIPGVSLTIPTRTSGAVFLFLYSALIYAEDGTYPFVDVCLSVGGTEYRPWLISYNYADGGPSISTTVVTAFKFLTLDETSQIAKLRFKKRGAGTTGYADEITLSYIRLGGS